MFWLILSFSFVAGAAQYRFDTWAIDDGLPQNSVRSIIQTRDGYLWIATLDGLARFDGVRFKVFNKSTNRELVSTRFISLCEADDGALWLGTENSGALRFYGGKFESFTTADGLPSNVLTATYIEAEGVIALQTVRGTAYWQNGKILPPAETEKFSGAQKTASGWMIEFPNRLSRKTAEKNESFPLPFLLTTQYEGKPFEDRDGAVWLTLNRAVWRFRSGVFERFDERQGVVGDGFYFLQDKDGAIWLSGGQNGVYQFRDEKFTLIATPDDLENGSVSVLFADREGTIWLGTHNNGLKRARRQLISTISAKNGLNGTNVYPIFPDTRGRVWVGTQNGNLNLIENGALRLFEIFDVRAITEAADGAIWICAKGRIDIYRDGRLEPLKDAPPELPESFAHAVQTDRAGAMWFSTDAGLFHNVNGEWARFDKSNGLPTDEAHFVHEAANGDFYIGTYDGLVLMRRGDAATRGRGEITELITASPRLPVSVSQIFTTADGLNSNHLRSIYEDADGVIWLGTYDGGLSRLKDGKFTNFTTADGLYNDGVFAILEDEAGNFWMSSNQGIHRVAKRELNDFADGKIKKLNGVGYGKRDGMLNAECNGGRQPSGAKTVDGRLWFATQNGAAIVDPKALTFNSLPPPVVIENALVDRERINFADEIRLEPNQSNLEIQFTALSFIRSEQMRFRYKLEGLSDDWIEAGTRRDAYFSYLPPGDYRFVVSAANADGVWNEQGAAVRVSVVPPFYRTSWFLALATLAVSLVIFAVLRYRFNQLQRERNLAQDFSRRLIESQEQERGRIAAELHDGLSQSLVIIKNRAALSLKKKKNAEHAFEQLEEIAQASTEAIDEAKEIIHNLRPIQLDRLGLTKAISAMLRRVSETHEIAFKNDIETIDNLFSKEAESSIYRILQESINNVVRHSAATEAVVRIRRSPGKIEILIKDNGKGFAVDSTQNGSERGGFGLTGIKERARLLGGEALIESNIGKGTEVRVVLPVEENYEVK